MKKLTYLFLTLIIVACSDDDTSNENPVYLDENGITIKAYEWAEVGATGEINGVAYTVVDETILRDMVENEVDVTKLATSKITDMSGLFLIEGDTFNQPIGNWDVSNVTDMSEMFSKAYDFDRPISNWDVSNVTDMSYMFYFADAFDRPIGNWNVSNVTDMSGMFYLATSFNQDISSWNIGNVIDMSEMFRISSNFNQPIEDWDVSSVTDMSYMFWAGGFNQDISSWSVDNVTDCGGFSLDAPLTEANTPNFTNCIP